MSDTVTTENAPTPESAPAQVQSTAPEPQAAEQSAQSSSVFDEITSSDDQEQQGDFMSELLNDSEEAQDKEEKDEQLDPEDQVPTEYNFEGIQSDVEYTDTDKNLVRELGKELKLTNRQAKELLQKGGAVLNKYRNEAVTKQVSIWSNQIRNDEEIGKGHFEETKKNCSLALKHYGSQNLEKLLRESNLGNHPDVVRFFNKIGKELREESNFAQGQPPTKKRNPMAFLDELYPSMSSK